MTKTIKKPDTMIKIASQDACHQYDREGRAITTWDWDKCSWIVNTEFENERIDWYGKDSDFPAGCTLAQWKEWNPDHENNPRISVVWIYNTTDALVKTFGDRQYWENKEPKPRPYTVTRSWNYLQKRDLPNIHSVLNYGSEGLHGYAGFSKGADRIIITYNNETVELRKSRKGKWMFPHNYGRRVTV